MHEIDGSTEQFRKDVIQTVMATYDTIAPKPARALVVYGQRHDGVFWRLGLKSHLPILGSTLGRSLAIRFHIKKHQIERLALLLRKPPAEGWPIRIGVTFIERDKPTVQTWEAVLPPGTQHENSGTPVVWKPVDGPGDPEILRLLTVARRAFREYGSARAA